MKKIMLIWSFFLFCTAFLCGGELPEVVVFATGGTIAGTHADKSATVGYQVATLPVETLLNAVPEINKFARLRGIQVFQIASENLTMPDWFKLASDIQKELDKKDVAGAVVTHGTDTLEETAYFLHLTLNSDKPVVLVGAMRPATAYSADGPLNLLNAAAVAAAPEARGLGVLVVMNDSIYGARDVRKGNTVRPDSFHAGNFGLLGTAISGKVEIYNRSAKLHTTRSIFQGLTPKGEIPRVDIIYCYGGTTADQLEDAIQRGSKGIVFACTGNGSLNTSLRPVVKKLTARGIPVVRATRVADGPVVRNGEVNDDEYKTIPAGTLSPQKARILLTLCLMKGLDQKAITKCFESC